MQWWDKIIFYLVYLTLFTVLSIEKRNMSGVFIQILMTHTLDLVTGSSLQEVQATNASQAKTARPILGQKSPVVGKRRVKNMQHGEKSVKS